MKTIKLTLLSLGGLVAFAGTALAQDTTPADRPVAALQLKVDVPPTHDLFYERDVAEALAYRVSETFTRRGYQGRIDDVLYTDDLKTGQPVLALNLIRWRRGAGGFVECTFTAELRQADGTVQSLGVFSANEIAWTPRTHWDLTHAFEDAARGAADQLWNTLKKRDLLPAVNAS